MSTTPRTTRLGELTAFDLGSHITFKDGGASYEGILEHVRHEHRTTRKTFVSVLAGKWRHADAYPANRPCVVTPVVLTSEGPKADGQTVAIAGPAVEPSAAAEEFRRMSRIPAGGGRYA